MPPSIAHIAVAVRDLEKAISDFTALLGFAPGSVEIVADQGVRLALFKGAGGNCDLELLEPLSAASPIGKFLEERGPGLHHVALRVPDLDRKLVELSHHGYRLIDAAPRIGAEGKKIAFVHPSSFGGVLLELIEE